ncbi:MAG: FAD-dependent oxidoreductase [Pseudomonadota bacterium]|nr:FAD-dependent oxidoreductase [Pseudomonadota bacterium]
MQILDIKGEKLPAGLWGFPVSTTTTEINLTGSWKFFRPQLVEKSAPCQGSCPLHIDIAGYMRELSRRDLAAALARLRSFNPLPAVCGRVCPNFCQQNCNRQDFDQAVEIGAVERFLGDYGLDIPFQAPPSLRPERVAVIGSGPAGLGCATFLASQGIRVTIYEKEAAPGGLLRYGIPAYRLPREILNREIDNLVNSLNIELCCNQEIQPEQVEKMLEEYDYVFRAPGLGQSLMPKDLVPQPGIYPGLELLHDIATGGVPSGTSFGVIGGGNVAVDAARSLCRLGKEVQIIYRRTFAEMPAYNDEKKQALEEGVLLRQQQLVTGVAAEAGQLQLTLNQAIAADEGGIKAGEVVAQLKVDGLVVAIGQQAGPYLGLNHERLLLGGDLVSGPATVVEAMASGKAAAKTILSRCGLVDEDLPESETPAGEAGVRIVSPADLHLDYCQSRKAIVPKEENPTIRRHSFVEIVYSLDDEEFFAEAGRCFNCGICTGCGVCWFFCPDLAIALVDGDGGTKVIIDEDHCKGCGLCAASCPRAVIEMKEDV